MTALAAPPAVPEVKKSGTRGGPLRAALRLHRGALVVWAAFVALGGIGLFQVRRLGEESAAIGTACASPPHDGLPPCDENWHALFGQTDYYSTYIGLAEALIAYLPVVLALYAAGALVLHEQQSGRHALLWTQAISPARWLAMKLAPAALLTMLGFVPLILLDRWARAAHPEGLGTDWYAADVFRSTGVVTFAYALLALAVGVLVALLVRRMLPALAVTGVLMTGAIVYANEYVRMSLWPPVTRYETSYHAVPHSALQLANRSWDADGNEIGWMARGSVRHYREFHPESHFWPIQLVEAGIVLALAGVLTATAFWLLRKRTP